MLQMIIKRIVDKVRTQDWTALVSELAVVVLEFSLPYEQIGGGNSTTTCSRSKCT